MNGYTHRAVFVGKRVVADSPYPLLLKPEGGNAQYLYFVMQALPLAEKVFAGQTFHILTFRKGDGRQVLENRRGQLIEGGWQLEGRAA